MSERICSLWWCDKTHYADGLCFSHYMNVRRHGDVISPKYKDAYAIRKKAQEFAVLSRLLWDVYLRHFMYNKDGECVSCGARYTAFHEVDCLVDSFFTKAYEISDSQSKITDSKSQE